MHYRPILTGLLERQLIVESWLKSRRWGLAEMCKILTEDILKFDVNESKARDFDMKHIPPQILLLLIVRCPVSPDVNKVVL